MAKVKPFAFIHIPKTAGSSMKTVLPGVGFSHIRYLDLSPEQKESFVFAFVRNPLDRLLSGWLFNKGNYRVFTHFEEAKNQFNEFVGRFKVNIEVNYRTGKHIIPQHWWVANEAGYVGVDFLGHYETLDEDFKIVANHIGVKPNLPKTHINKTKHRHYYHYYTPESEAKVREVYRKDFELFYGGV